MTAPVRFVARSVAEAAALLDIHRATLSDFLSGQDRADLWEETPGGRKRFTQGHINRLWEAYYRVPSNDKLVENLRAEMNTARARLKPKEAITADSFVYFFFCKTTDLLKIGMSRDPFARLADLRSKTGLALEIIQIEPGGREEERWYHQRFAAQRAEGEWFRCEGSLKRFVEALG